MNILYLTDSRQFGYHKDLIKDFLSVTGGEVFDLSDDYAKAKKYQDIENFGADVIITFDGAGLDYRTVMDTLSFNNLFARMAHILFHKPSFYGQMLELRQNLSMFTYIPCTEDLSSCRTRYPEIPNLNEFGKCFYKADNEKEHETNRETVRAWWDDFKREAML